MRYSLLAVVISTTLISSCGGGGSSSTPGATNNKAAMEALGKKLFFDQLLSSSSNQSCGSCHDPAAGFADPNVSVTAPVSEGSEKNTNSFGNRNAPTAAYASFSPVFAKTATDTTTDGTTSNYRGGQFLDGRRPNLIEQAKDPFLNAVEMNNASAADVVTKVSNSTYASDFTALFGSGAFDNTTTAYNNIAKAIAAFETSSEVNKFSSKFDDVMKGTDTFTASEQRGFDLFKGTTAKCANCHTIPTNGPILFTNHRYYNIGTPSNLNNPAVQANSGYIDNGLAENTSVIDAGDAATTAGKFRTPTLRNIALTAPYMHNGVYSTLEQVITHYDIRVAQGLDPLPEVSSNIANELTNNGVALGFGGTDAADLVAFLNTLTDQ